MTTEISKELIESLLEQAYYQRHRPRTHRAGREGDAGEGCKYSRRDGEKCNGRAR